MQDTVSGERIGKLVFTLFKEDSRKALEIIDADITLDSAEATELRKTFLASLKTTSTVPILVTMS